MNLSRVNTKNRIESVDALRGFALLGIIIANIPYSANFGISGSLDSVMTFLFHFLIDKKFITIFSILFGFGFYFQMQNATEKQINFTKYFVFRMLLLFGIGSVHAFIIWNGDILRAYALGGILLLLVRNLSTRKLLILAVLFSVVFTALIYVWLTVFGWGYHNFDLELAKQLPVTNSYFNYLKLNFIFDPWVNIERDMPLTIVFTFGNMLIGFIFGRIGFFNSPQKFRHLTIWFITLGITFGLASSFIYFKIISDEIVLDISMIGVPLIIVAGMISQSLLYISAFIELYNKNRFKKVLRVFIPVGRTALSNYVTQSLFYMFVFFHCFSLFQLYGILSSFQTWMVAIGFFTIQTIASHFYLKRFNQGPIEYLWKKAAYSYGNKQK